MPISLAQAKSLCTAAELGLFKASTRNEIGKLSSADVQQRVTRARTLRDKWRDLARSQRRATQAAKKARGTAIDSRADDKAELFAEVLTRFETQFAKLTAADRISDGRMPKRVRPRARSAGHRATRAVVRAELKEEAFELSTAPTPAKRKPAAKKPAPAAPPAPIEEAPAVLLPIPRKRGKKPPMAAASLGKGKVSHAGAGMTGLQSGREIQGLRVTKAKQLRASTAAKPSRLQASEIMRVKGNAAANTRRRQAKRDSR